MKGNVSLSSAAKAHVVSLVVACVRFLILLAAGMPESQPFPPRVIVLLAAATAVVLMPQLRWIPLIGMALGLAIAVGAFFVYDSTLQRLTNPGEVVPFLGTVIQMGGIVVAIVAGGIALLRPRTRPARPVPDR